MATLLIQTAQRTWTSTLPAVCLVGRHPACIIRIDDPSVPSFWLELRWTGSEWTWRPLSDSESTRGPGTPTPAGWRIWRARLGDRRQAIRIGGVRVRLTDIDAPVPMVEWTTDGRCDAIVSGQLGFQLGGDEVCWSGTPGAASMRIHNGDSLVIGNQPCRVWIPDHWSATDRPRVSLSDHQLQLILEEEPSKVTLLAGGVGIDLQGEEVRLLRVYAEARASDPRDRDCGYRTTREARAAWIALGGNPESPPERLAWLRNRLRTMLDEVGVVGSAELFERRRRGREWSHRLVLDPEMVQL